MNAGLVSIAPTPPPPGPQASPAPGASAAPPKEGGERFSTHLAKAVAVKAPVKAPETAKATPDADQSPTEAKAAAVSTAPKPQRDATQMDQSDLAQQKDDPAAEPAADVLDQPQIVALDQTPTLVATQVSPQEDCVAVASTPPTEAKDTNGSSFGSKVQAQQAPPALQTVQADLTTSPALQQLVSEITATAGEVAAASSQTQKADPTSFASPAAPKSEAPKKDAIKTEASKVDPAKLEAVQAILTQDDPNQAMLSQVAAEDLNRLGAEKLASATGSKATDAATSTTKTETTTPASKGAKAEAGAQSVQSLGASVIASAQSDRSGGEATPRQGDGADAGSSASKLASANEAAATAPPQAQDAPQPLMAAPIHVAPQTLQTAAVVMKAGPQTVASLASQIVSKAEAGATRFDLELHPLDLGRVDVRLEVGASGQVSASMSFETPQAAAEMRARSTELQRALESAGFDLSGGLSFDVAGDRGQGGSRNSGDEPSLAQRARALETATTAASDVADSAMSTLMGAYGARPSRGVDIRI